MKIDFLKFAVVLGFAGMIACTKKAETPVVEKAVSPIEAASSTQVPTGPEVIAGSAVAQVPNEDLKLDETEIGKQWSSIWELSDPYPALKEFSVKHGLYLETGEKIGEQSVLGSEGPCGEDYVSLVKDTKALLEKVWEIKPDGKVLREWNPGTEDILRIEKNTLFRVVDFVKKPSDFNLTNTQRDEDYASFVISIQPNGGGFAVLSEDAVKPKKWSVEEVTCPKGLKVESDYKYCVKEKKTKRMFVLQKPCT